MKTIIRIIAEGDINDGVIVKVTTIVMNKNKKIKTRRRINCDKQIFPLK